MSYIDQLSRKLKTLSSPSLDELRTVMPSILPASDQYHPLVKPPRHLAYGRHVLYSSDQVEAILIHLPARTRTAIHDHGGSIGCAAVLEGEMTNVIYTLDAYGYPVAQSNEKLCAGESSSIDQRLIHEMVNPSATDRMVSLHLYAPPLRNIKTYIPFSEVLDFVI